MTRCTNFKQKKIWLSLTLALAMTGFFSLSPAQASQYRKSEINATIAELSSDNLSIVKTAAYHITEMGPEAREAVPRLTEILQSQYPGIIKGEVCKALGNIGSASQVSVPAIIAFMKDYRGGYDRAYAPTALGNIGASPELCVPALVETLNSDPEPTVQRLAARALGDFKASASCALPALVKAIKEGNREMREAACDSLAKIPANAESLSLVCELLGDDLDDVRTAAAKSLSLGGEAASPAVPQLAKLLQDQNLGVRETALTSLGSLGVWARAAKSDLKSLLNDPDLGSLARETLKKIESK